MRENGVTVEMMSKWKRRPNVVNRATALATTVDKVEVVGKGITEEKENSLGH